MNSLVEQAVALRTLLSRRASWAKSDLARDDAGNVVNPCDGSASCFCLLGGVAKIGGVGCDLDIKSMDDVQGIYDQATRHPLGKLVGEAIRTRQGIPNAAITSNTIWSYNDDAQHHDVVKVLDVAVGLALAKVPA